MPAGGLIEGAVVEVATPQRRAGVRPAVGQRRPEQVNERWPATTSSSAAEPERVQRRQCRCRYRPEDGHGLATSGDDPLPRGRDVPRVLDDNDRERGQDHRSGRDQTFIDGGQIPPTNGRIFIAQGRTTFAELDISGARTPSDLSADCISKNGTISPASCGKAFVNNSDLLTLRSVDCHDNGGNCVAGAGSLIMDDVNCWNNGGDVRRLDHKRSSSRAEQP